MCRVAITVWLALGVASLAVGAFAPGASASTILTSRLAPDGIPNLAVGIDTKRLADTTYIEQLAGTSEKHSKLVAKIKPVLEHSADLVDFGSLPGSDELVVYWSGTSDGAELKRIQQLVNEDGVGLVVATRDVSRAQLASATDRIEARSSYYESRGIALSAYGGFAADFDGVKVYVDKADSKLKDSLAIERFLEADLGVPVNVSYGAARTFAGKYDDFSPFNGGGLMMGDDDSICTTGLGVVYGASVYRYLSARHCNASMYHTETGRVLGAQQLVGTGYNGAAVYSEQGSYLVFDGSNVGNLQSYRTVTQKDPALSTVGTLVCQEGANLGKHCGTIRQVALNFDDGQGIIRVNYVRSTDGSVIAAPGDSGAAVITNHTQQRAWAVGILQGGFDNENSEWGADCPTRYVLTADRYCSDNFIFTNVDYALSGFASYAIRYF